MDQTINDLLNGSENGKLQVSSEETEEKLKHKIEEIEIKEKEKLVAEKASPLGLSCISLKGFPIEPEALSLIPEEKAKAIKAVCFLRTEEELRIGVVDPANPEISKIIGEFKEKFPRLNTELYLISEYSLQQALKLYAAIPKIKKVIAGVEISGEELNKYRAEIKSFRELNNKLKKVSLTEMVTIILAGAIQARSSDIHIEAEEKDIKVRYRVDGVLQDVAVLPQEWWPKIISRIKIISGLKINIVNRPQDGRITIYLEDDKIDVRVSTLPSAFGESVVMRLLMSQSVGLKFEDLGIRGKSYEDLKRESKRPNGMIVTTGPTGSGKTTTLYAILNTLNRPETKIITLEDPIEYKLKGIVQSQVSGKGEGDDEDLKTILREGLSGGGGGKKGYSFAQGLRAILRQDPDIIMVGEIRDLETAEIAIQAALTGHLVISTIHTNDAAGAIPRFLSMGAKPFLLAPALNAVIGQRLVRRICKECQEEISLDETILTRVKEILSQTPENSGEKVDLDNLQFFRGKGCDQCNGIGYKGRIGIYEIFTMNKEIEEIILSGKVSEYQMKEVTVKHGMITMVQDGLLKAKDGITTIEEVFRVTE
ncbi:MAG: hypothetical protein COT24_05090 [Candidatus Kerfeldbacteria bacterium CG08_land_8_20_14_0_20_40_16]|uniref:Bacterial type II secretion system protein E domain-containing protein n=1 Tax=Candidatus Kerfeldbacteria bacterium CG08_land_8_20_14_0_20_40_16 TaxID=2014244 RepID=A0A2H0YWQ7_9BACT|nr:MAG: hypothetical protein COT24_05090 [Candidatus Kerfeldbacteria bacterium CG08_land_8_20_14_0_20_40_16]